MKINTQIIGGLWRKSLILSAALLLVMSSLMALVPKTVSAFAGGDGSSESPFQISNCLQLSDINDNLDAVFELTSNISCSGVDPGRIGSGAEPFTGTFNGNGHTIADITVVNTENNMGLFGNTNEATIYNVVLDNIYFGGTDNVGALIGTATYTNIWYISVINSNIEGTGQHTGGIVGYLGGSAVSRSYVDETTVTGNINVGGISGTAIGPSAISDSYAMPGGTAGVVGNTNVGGLAGQFGPGPTLIQNSYSDRTLVGSDQSSVSITDSYVVTVPISPPWDFDTVWENTNPFPTLRLFPQKQCEIPESTVSTIGVACNTDPALLGDATWEVQYAFADSTSWTPLPEQSGAGFDVTINDTLPGTEYKVRFRFNWNGLTSGWGLQEIITVGDSDADGDGISNKEESLGPNSGDANNDGTRDYLQANVTSFISFISQKYVVLKTSCSDNFNVQIGRESDETNDTPFDYPAGLVGFVGRNCGVGAKVDVTIHFYGNYDAGLSVRKYVNGAYVTAPSSLVQNTTIGGNSVAIASFQIIDGSAYDDDSIADGNIVDPVGLATNLVGAPNTGLSDRL